MKYIEKSGVLEKQGHGAQCTRVGNDKSNGSTVGSDGSKDGEA